jgi:hypothetical protein
MDFNSSLDVVPKKSRKFVPIFPSDSDAFPLNEKSHPIHPVHGPTIDQRMITKYLSLKMLSFSLSLTVIALCEMPRTGVS